MSQLFNHHPSSVPCYDTDLGFLSFPLCVSIKMFWLLYHIISSPLHLVNTSLLSALWLAPECQHALDLKQMSVIMKGTVILVPICCFSFHLMSATPLFIKANHTPPRQPPGWKQFPHLLPHNDRWLPSLSCQNDLYYFTSWKMKNCSKYSLCNCTHVTGSMIAKGRHIFLVMGSRATSPTNKISDYIL